MFLQERYRRQPWRRPSSRPDAPAPDDALDPGIEADPERLLDDGPNLPAAEHEPNAWDEADALVAMPSDEFLRGLRADIDAVASGQLPSMVEAERASPKDRPWSRHHVRRDKRGRPF